MIATRSPQLVSLCTTTLTAAAAATAKSRPRPSPTNLTHCSSSSFSSSSFYSSLSLSRTEATGRCRRRRRVGGAALVRNRRSRPLSASAIAIANDNLITIGNSRYRIGPALDVWTVAKGGGLSPSLGVAEIAYTDADATDSSFPSSSLFTSKGCDQIVYGRWRYDYSFRRCCRSFSAGAGTSGNGGATTATETRETEKEKEGTRTKAKTTKKTALTPKKVTVLSLLHKKRRGAKITMVTAYDYPSALHVDRAGIDVLLVGDSCAMVELGFETTQPMTMDQMIHHCQAVKRGAPNRPLLVGDMPFGTYEYEDSDVALKNAYRMVKYGGMDAVKMEGGSIARAKTVKKVVEGGVAVMGHVGLTPQAISVIGGFRAQGRTAARARQLLDDALRLQDAGAFCIVLECVPSNVAKAITDTLEVPTIGIGAGGGTSGQVLVYHDMLGMSSHPHHEQFVPKFCKRYADVGHAITRGLEEYKNDVESGAFPGDEYAPYVMTEEERVIFDDLLAKDAEERQRKHNEAARKLKQADEYEQLSLYGDTGK